MRLQAAIQGNLRALLKVELRGAERAITAGVRAVTLSLKTELRAQVVAAGLGRCLDVDNAAQKWIRALPGLVLRQWSD